MGLSTNSDAFMFQKLLMVFTGLWPKRDASIIYKIYGFAHYGSVVFLCLSLLISTMVLKDFSQLVQACSMFFAILNCCIKFTIFRFKMPAFIELLEFLNSPHFSYHQEKFDHYLQKIILFATAVVKLFFCSGCTTVVCILLAPVLQPQDVRTTPLPFPVMFNEKSNFFYVVVYAFQCVSLSSAAITSIGFDNLSTSMMGLCSAYFSILQESILEATIDIRVDVNGNVISNNENLEKNIDKYLNDCVEHHLGVITLTEKIENIFSYVFLSQFLCSAFGICLVGFTFINAKPGSIEFIFALSFLGTLMFQITLYCSYGNEVTVQSSMVGNACYMTEWIYCGSNVRRDLFFIMERSKRPMFLTAGKFVNLSLASLMSVIRSAVSYAMVLYQLYNN